MITWLRNHDWQAELDGFKYALPWLIGVFILGPLFLLLWLH
jgi:hypothetical protein